MMLDVERSEQSSQRRAVALAVARRGVHVEAQASDGRVWASVVDSQRAWNYQRTRFQLHCQPLERLPPTRLVGGGGGGGGGASRFPPRRSLIDTFVDRNDDYWMNRVVLRIDVPYTDHSHIIGRGGKNSQAVMRETTCHIHFPDSNKSADMDKSNQVTIAGGVQSVEDARFRLRVRSVSSSAPASVLRVEGLAPLTVSFELRQTALRASTLPDAMADNAALEVDLGFQQLSIVVRFNRSSRQPFCVVRGSVTQEADIARCLEHLSKRFFVDGTEVEFTTSLEVLPPQQPAVIGNGGCNMHFISAQTGAYVLFPQPADASRGASAFYIKGSPASIIAARRAIIAALPVSLSFDVFDERQRPDLDLHALESQYGVEVQVRYKPNADGKSVTVKGIEGRVGALYAVHAAFSGSRPVNVRAEAGDVGPSLARFFNTALLATAAVATPAAPSPHLIPHTPQPQILPPAIVQLMPTAGLFPLTTATPPMLFDAPSPAVSTAVCPEPPPTTPLANSAPSSPPLPAASDRNDPSPHNSPCAAALLNGARETDLRYSLGALLLERCCLSGNWRAPGAGRHLQYEDMKLQAARAKQGPIVGERFPTSDWSGLLFSDTAPASSALRTRGGASAGRKQPAIGRRAVERAAFMASGGGGTPTSTLPEVPENAVMELKAAALTGWPDFNGGDAEKRKLGATNYFDSEQTDLHDWDPDVYTDLSTVLARLEISHLHKVFIDEEVDFESFLLMDEDDFQELKIPMGHRVKLRIAVMRLRQELRRKQDERARNKL